MQHEVPVYLLRFRNSRGKSCPGSPWLLDLFLEIFSLSAVSHSAHELQTLSVHSRWVVARAPHWTVPSCTLGWRRGGKPKSSLQSSKESCLRVWFKSGTHGSAWLLVRDAPSPGLSAACSAQRCFVSVKLAVSTGASLIKSACVLW